MWNIPVTLLIIFGLKAAAAESLGNQVGCYRALAGKASGANYALENQAVLIPGSKDAKRGFHLFSNRMAYFCDFPPRPQDSNDRMDYYYLELKIPGMTSEYITYSDIKANPTNPGLAINSSPAEALAGKYITPKCSENLSDDSRKVLTEELKARVATVRSTFDRHAKYMRERFQQEEKVDKYRAALDICRSAGADVTKSAVTEMAKFSAPGEPTKPSISSSAK